MVQGINVISNFSYITGFCLTCLTIDFIYEQVRQTGSGAFDAR